LQALAVVAHVADLGLEPRHLGGGGVQRPLGLVERLAGGVVRLPRRFQFGL